MKKNTLAKNARIERAEASSFLHPPTASTVCKIATLADNIFGHFVSRRPPSFFFFADRKPIAVTLRVRLFSFS
jgi:hypothetical protein